MQLFDFDFALPKNLIAQSPVSPRDSSKLMYVNADGSVEDMHFHNITDLLASGDLLVFNNTKVLPALLYGNCRGKEVQVNLVERVTQSKWKILAKPRKRLKQGAIIIFDNTLQAKIATTTAHDQLIEIDFLDEGEALYEKLNKIGNTPLPPYIKRSPEEEMRNKSDYQTVYAKEEGSVAAPTAGLHFTHELIEKLKSMGVKTVFCTLHIGLGTFYPIRTNNIQDHYMHSECFHISKATCKLIQETKRAGKRVIAVGTSSMRTLESMAQNERFLSTQGKTDLFIRPGYQFRVVDALITNFHLPKSTLFILTCAFCGTEKMRKVYEHAIQANYRFFSYGDACFLEKSSYCS